MSEGEHHAQTTIRNLRMVGTGSRLARPVVKDSLTPEARCGRPVTMAEWGDKLEAFLSFNERDVLTHAGRLRMDVAHKLAAERFEVFDANRRAAQALALAADEADIAQLEEIEKAAKGRKKGAGDE